MKVPNGWERKDLNVFDVLLYTRAHTERHERNLVTIGTKKNEFALLGWDEELTRWKKCVLYISQPPNLLSCDLEAGNQA